MKKIYNKYVELVYKVAMIVATYIALNLAAALTFHNGEFFITVEEQKK